MSESELNIRNPSNPSIVNKNKLLTVRIGDGDLKMINELKSYPYFINISDFVRASIKNLYKVRVSKEGRIGKGD